MAEERLTGVVQWFNDSKGFGFIKPDVEGPDLFVHQSSIKSDGYRSLVVGDHVEFQIAPGDDGKSKAIEVVALDGSSGNRRDNFGSGGGGGGGGCFNCGEYGHIARDCQNESRGSGGGGGGRFGGGGGGGGGSNTCFNCGKSGHFARECPDAS